MFERYTRKARKAVFFARYEASRHGTPEIGTPSLLLGVLWEDQDLMDRLLPAGPEELARLCASVAALLPKSSRNIFTKGELPLSRAATRALGYAAGEADRRHHKFIEPRHLLWGLLTECGPEAACMKSHGIAEEALNDGLARIAGENGRSDRRALRRTLEAIHEDRLDAAATLLEGLGSGKFEVTGAGRNGSFHFSFDDKTD